MTFVDDLIAMHFAKAPKRRVMREFALDEISAVTRPAQTGARALIMKMKSADAAGEAYRKGRMRLTLPVDGHAHLVELDDYSRVRGGGYTLPSGTGGNSHSHPFTLSGNGEIVIGESDGHAHEMAEASATSKGSSDMRVMTQGEVNKALNAAGVGKGMVSEAVQKLDEMTRARQAAAPLESYAESYSKVLATPLGAELYEATIK